MERIAREVGRSRRTVHSWLKSAEVREYLDKLEADLTREYGQLWRAAVRKTTRRLLEALDDPVEGLAACKLVLEAEGRFQRLRQLGGRLRVLEPDPRLQREGLQLADGRPDLAGIRRMLEAGRRRRLASPPAVLPKASRNFPNLAAEEP